jgi:hypothetical protein
VDEVRPIPLPEGEPRVETGPVQFGNDWPGIFIRGDVAFGFRMMLSRVLNFIGPRDSLTALELQDLCDLLESCRIGDDHCDQPT